jgi:hypothetical protein
MVVGGGCSCREEGWLKMEEEEENDRMVGGEDFGWYAMEKKEKGEDNCKGFSDFTKTALFYG